MNRSGNNLSKDLEVRDLIKKYDADAAVDGVSFQVRAGSLVTLLGPSGCGKTTTLRMIGGLIVPTAGTIAINGRDITHLPPWKRNCGFVFQSYALFPHMKIRENIAYGLRVRGWAEDQIRAKVAEVADFMDIAPHLDRLPRELSGGQQQRSAVARALAIEPDILLMDEPLANLDAQLRERIRFEIRRLQSELGITIVYVTHDQSEAFSISDEILVMRSGRIVQRGTPQKIFARPATPFVASFVGVNNLMKGRVLRADAGVAEIEFGQHRLRGQCGENIGAGDEAIAVAAAHRFRVVAKPDPDKHNHLSGRVSEISFMGTHCRMLVRTEADVLTVDLPVEQIEQAGIEPEATIHLEADGVHLIQDKD